MEWISEKIILFLDWLPDISRIGLFMFGFAVCSILYSDIILDPKISVRRAIDFFHKRINKQSDDYLQAQNSFYEFYGLAVITVIGIIGMFLFLIGFLV